MASRKNVIIIVAFALAVAMVELVYFFFVSWRAILSFPMLFMFLRPVEQRKRAAMSIIQFCYNCGHKIKAYQNKWKHFDGKIRTELCMRKDCDCYHALSPMLVSSEST